MSAATMLETSTAPTRELERALTGELRYSRVWEDHLLLERGLDVNADDNVLIIASAGCNVLNLLLQGPRNVVALDFNVAQTALVQLKLAGIRALNHAGFLELLGINGGNALGRYQMIRSSLDHESRAWWDGHVELLAAGVEGAGRLDSFFARFHREHIARIHPASLVDRFLALRTMAERRDFAKRELFTSEFEAAFLAYFTREAIAADGRHPAQFRYAPESDVAEWFLSRLRWACTRLPVRGNFYLERFLRGGTVQAEWLPPYLLPENYNRLRTLLPRVDVVTTDLESYLASAGAHSITKAALSNVFEYMSADDADATFASLAYALPRRARIAYWNLLVSRTSPGWLRRRLQPLGRRARSLSREDRAWFYGAFHVEEVSE